DHNGTLNVYDATFNGNQTGGSAKLGGEGGAIFVYGSDGSKAAQLHLTNSILSGSTSTSGTAHDLILSTDRHHASEAYYYLRNDLAPATPGFTPLPTQSYPGCGGTAVIGGDPLLDDLSYNGGPTRTEVPEAGSPALGAGLWNLISQWVDQRGLDRSIDNSHVD